MVRWVTQLAILWFRSNDFKELEIVVLRHELAILPRRNRRPAISWTDRLLLTAASRLSFAKITPARSTASVAAVIA